MKVLVLNSGSSSQKSALYDVRNVPPPDPPVRSGADIEWATDAAHLRIRTSSGAVLDENVSAADRGAALERMLQMCGKEKRQSCRTKLAFEIFVHRLQQAIAAMASSLGGIEVLTFSAGIGEHSPEVRRAACEKLAFLGIQLDPHNNTSSVADQEISARDSNVRIPGHPCPGRLGHCQNVRQAVWIGFLKR